MKSLIFLLTISWPLLGIEIDEKLTIRILKTSKSRKTILINRGSEDGLVEGDHAKFYVTKGIIGRGILVKVSPGRSVWSIYRVIDPYEIEVNKVANLKKAIEVPLTNDATQGYNYPLDDRGVSNSRRHVVSTGNAFQIEDSEDLEGLDFEELDDYTSLVQSESSSSSSSPLSEEAKLDEELDMEFDLADVDVTGTTRKNRRDLGDVVFANRRIVTNEDGSVDLYISPSFNLLTNNYKWQSNTESDDLTKFAIRLGLEKYLYTFSHALNNFSIEGMFNVMITDQGNEVSRYQESLFALGLGAKWFVHNSPTYLNTFLPYLGLGVGIGIVNGKFIYAGVNETGTATIFNVNAGVRYLLSNGWGASIALNYDYVNSTYPPSTSTSELGASLGKVDVELAISYRLF